MLNGSISTGLLLATSLPLLFNPSLQGGCGGSGSGAPTAEDLLAITQDCDPLDGVGYFSNDNQGSNTIPMCELDGAIWFRADFDVDCDGGSEDECKADPYYQSHTSAHDSNGNPLDASHLPFTVLPLDSNGFSMNGQDLGLGQVSAVIYNGILYYGPLGDRGPSGTVGEGSYAMAERLGINPNPVSGGVGSGVTYIFFTGDESEVYPIESESEAQLVGAEQATRLLIDN